jgi:hypothetical protein
MLILILPLKWHLLFPVCETRIITLEEWAMMEKKEEKKRATFNEEMLIYSCKSTHGNFCLACSL